MSVHLTASATSSLHSIQRNQSLGDKFAGQLATGRKVNSVGDNAQAFVLASGLTERANSLSDVGSAIGQSIGALQAADNGLQAISQVVNQLKGLASQAQASSDPNEQAALQSQYNTLRGQIDQIASDSSYNGVNLISSNPGGVALPGASSATSSSVSGQAADSTALGVTAASNWSTNPSSIQSDLQALDQATRQVQAQSADLGSNITTLQTKAAFVQGQSNTARDGAAKLTSADINEAAASAQAAATYRKLGHAALRHDVQSQDQVLALFGRR
jgi:flagellin